MTRFISRFFGVGLLAALVAACTVPNEIEKPEDRWEDVVERVADVTASVESFYLESYSVKDMVAHIDEIKSIEGVADAYSTETCFYVVINGWGAFGYPFKTIDDNSEKVDSDYLEQISSSVPVRSGSEDSFSANGEYKACIMNAQHQERQWTRPVASATLSMFNKCGFEATPVNDPTLDFFNTEIFNYNLIFIIGHGEYDSSDNSHWLQTVETFEIPKNEKERDKVFEKYRNIVNQYQNNEVRCYYSDKSRNNTNGIVFDFFVSESYIRNASGSFPKDGKAVLFMVPCQTLMGDPAKEEEDAHTWRHQGRLINDSMADAFFKKGAGLYIGYDESSSSLAQFGGMHFFARLLSGYSFDKALNELPTPENDEALRRKRAGYDPNASYSFEKKISYNDDGTVERRWDVARHILTDNGFQMDSYLVKPRIEPDEHPTEYGYQFNASAPLIPDMKLSFEDYFDVTYKMPFSFIDENTIKYGFCVSKEKDPSSGQNHPAAIDRKYDSYRVDLALFLPSEILEAKTEYHIWPYIAKGDEYNYGDAFVFTTKERIPDPPTVETFPASVDLAKAFLSGMVNNRSLEGLETGFYYYKMTAQEAAKQLSEDEKLKLVLTGKKVRSAGDYKDYFGIDLTDIEHNSTYLFVAYATDEYGQTGLGQVLSFKVGSPVIHVASVSLNKTQLELTVGGTATLTATVLPENAGDKSVTWSSSNTSVATVSSTGVVKGVAAGPATITVTTVDGGKTASCTVTVRQATVPVQSVSLNKTQLDLTVGNTATLTATVLPENATNKSVTWSSSNTSVATVTSSGVVKGVAAGPATITATTVDGGKTASCKVTVAALPEPKLSVSTKRLDFGNQIKFTQKTQNITITNSGTGTLQISSITKTSNYGDLFQLSGWTSGGSIAAGASKTITVSFQPLEERYYEETLTIVSSNSVGDKKVVVTLCGTGIPEPEDAQIKIDVEELKWGEVEVGESVNKSFAVKNTGSTALNVSSVKIVATDNTVNPSYFTVSPNGSFSLSPGKSKTFTVTFSPEAVSSYSAMLSIKSNASNATQGTSTVWLSGSGIKATSKVLTASPSSLSFGYQTVGNRTHKNFTVKNTGTKAVTLYSMVATDGFVVDQTWADGNSLGLAAGASKTFSAYFAPTQVKSYSGKITIKSNAANGDLVIPLSGIGEEAQGYLEIVSGENLDFGNVNLGASGTLTAKIRNTGEARLNILGITCPDGFSAACSASSISEGYNATVTISFVPSVAKTYSGSVIIHTDAENESVSINVTGKGIKSSTGNTFVDMGLSVKWASANVGASNPEEYGHYVAWGETATKTQYLYNNYKYYDANSYFSDNGFIKKYCSNSSYGYQGYFDLLKMLTYDDDYAQAKQGGLARIPTRAEWEELKDKNNCSWSWTTQEGVNGYLVTSLINGNSIFLPAGGSIEYSNNEVNSVGYYWTADLNHENTYATTWELRSDKAWYSYRERYKGLTVRAVEDYTAKPMIDTDIYRLRFEGVKLGTTASKTITIRNIGKGTLHITEVRSTKRVGLEWTYATIEPGASKKLTVYYTPKSDPDLVIEDPETWDMTTLTISSDARNGSEYTMYVSGYGIGSSGNIEGTQEEPWN